MIDYIYMFYIILLFSLVHSCFLNDNFFLIFFYHLPHGALFVVLLFLILNLLFYFIK